MTTRQSEQQHVDFVCDPATCENEQHDHTTPVDDDGMTVDPPVPMTCGDCGRPSFYDYADDKYHHNVDRGLGCFLIPAE